MKYIKVGEIMIPIDVFGFGYFIFEILDILKNYKNIIGEFENCSQIDEPVLIECIQLEKQN